MTHLSEAEFQDAVVSFFVDEVGEENVEEEVYQPAPRWYVDVVVERPEVTWYVELENDADSIRDGIGQALGYAADHPGAAPMVVVPLGHLDLPDVDRLRSSQAILIREFDLEEGTIV